MITKVVVPTKTMKALDVYFCSYSIAGSSRSPFSLLSGKSFGPNNFWLRQFEIVCVGVTIGPFVGATFGPFVGPTLLGLSKLLEEP